MLKIQELMRSGMDYASLYEKHGVVAKPYNGKVSFAYDMIASKDEDPVARQCRGLILEEGTWNLIAYPFDRFFNHGQGAAATIDMETAVFEEKLDGTLIIGYFHDGTWQCATRQMCEAHGDINGVGTFARLVDKACNLLGYQSFHEMMTESDTAECATYMFELISPYNKIVCDYDKIELVFLGARDLIGGKEFNSIAFPRMRRPKVWKLKSIEDMLEVCQKWSPLEYEGVILKDANFNRVKIKTPQYLAMAHASESLGASWRAIATCVLTGAADDMIPQVVPAIAERLKSMQEGIAALEKRVHYDYFCISGINDMKKFAEAATQCLWSTPLFMVKRKKAPSIKDYIRSANVDTVLDYVRKNGWVEPSA